MDYLDEHLDDVGLTDRLRDYRLGVLHSVGGVSASSVRGIKWTERYFIPFVGGS